MAGGPQGAALVPVNLRTLTGMQTPREGRVMWAFIPRAACLCAQSVDLGPHGLGLRLEPGDGCLVSIYFASSLHIAVFIGFMYSTSS